jgi:GNAT superfamily N-acetyltransferase
MHIRRAETSDNEGLQDLTSATPMGGEISIRIDRHPDFFRLLEQRGRSHVLVAEDDGKIVGCISVAEVMVYVNGKQESVHYLGDLKVYPDYQRTGLAVRLVKSMHRYLLSVDADIVIWTAAYGNRSVLPFFDGRAGLPKASAIGIFNVYQILPSPQQLKNSAYVVQVELLDQDLCRLYNEHFRSYQFGSLIKPGPLQEIQHWGARSCGQLRAAISLIDIGNAKQNVLIRLPFILRILFFVLRILRLILPIPNLPEKNKPVRILYIKALACCEGYEDALTFLIQKSRNVAFKRNYHFLSLGVHENDPLRKLFTRYPKFTFKSMGFVVNLKRENNEMQHVINGVPFEDYSLV